MAIEKVPSDKAQAFNPNLTRCIMSADTRTDALPAIRLILFNSLVSS
jgi:hypothetical protein